VNDGEDGRGRADAKREREHRDECEVGRAPQGPNAVAEVEQRILDQRRAELIACALFDVLSTQPNLIYACRRASSGVMPTRRFLLVCRSM
jgi:hypothetical protein